jgi:UDPglucose 6-dehydrogenase
MSEPVIGFAGMSHLGLVSSVASAEKGYHVICFDPDAGRIEALRRQELPISEPDLPELFSKNQERLTFTENVDDLNKCHVTYIAQDVSTDDQGQSDIGPIAALIEMVDQALRPDTTMVIVSQVPPGFTRSRLQSGRLLYYQVETLIFGRAVERALYPERFIVGCSDPTAPLPGTYAQYLECFNCPILPMRFESAELAKISINCCLVSSISTANTLAEICEKIGADWSEIVPALRLDRRIGQYSYIVPGLGISGGNLERDLHSVLRLSEKHNTDDGVITSWLRNSDRRKIWAFELLNQTILTQNPEATIAVLGLAYKENTHSTKNSPALLLIKTLSNCSIKAYDPVVDAIVAGNHVSRALSAVDAADGADAVVIMTPWPEFRDISPTDLSETMKGQTVIDPYGMLDAEKVASAGLDYFTLGKPPVLTINT